MIDRRLRVVAAELRSAPSGSRRQRRSRPAARRFPPVSWHARLLAFALGLVLPSILAAAPLRAADTVAIDVVFALDNSGSMRSHDPGHLTRRAVLDFAHDLAARSRREGAAARVGIVLFDEEIELALPLTPLAPETVDAALAPALARLDYGGQRTRSADAIERALYALRADATAGARQAIVLLTDGKLDTGDPTHDLEAAKWLREDLAAESRERGIRIFGLAFTDRADYQLLQALARKTDAAYYRAERADELAPIVGRVLAQIAGEAAPAAAAARTSESAQPDPQTGTSHDGSVAPDEPAAARASDVAGAPGARTAPRVSAAPATAGSASSPLARPGRLPLALMLAAAGGLALVRLRAAARGADATRVKRSALADMPAQLLDVGGVLGETGRAVALSPGRTRIGRDGHNDVVIADVAISSEHAVIERVDGRYWLEDLRSTNGTRHADRRLAPGERVLLKGGDHVRFAEIDLMFIHPGHVPAGATVVLPATSAPPSAWPNGRAGPARRGGCASGSGRFDEQARERIAGTGAGGVGASVTPLFDERAGEAFRACLDDHLGRVAALSRDFAAFVTRGFDEDMRDAVRVAANELVKAAQREGRLVRRVYTRDRIRYVLCGVSGDVEDAARAYQSGHGGFSRFLGEEIDDEGFRAGRCEILAVLTCGRASGIPWVSLSVVPDPAYGRPIDLMSYELLSDAERRALGPAPTRDTGQSGLG